VKKHPKCWITRCRSCGERFHVQGFHRHSLFCNRDEMIQILQGFIEENGYEVKRKKEWGHEWLIVTIRATQRTNLYYAVGRAWTDEMPKGYVAIDKVWGGHSKFNIYDPKFFSKVKRHLSYLRREAPRWWAKHR